MLKKQVDGVSNPSREILTPQSRALWKEANYLLLRAPGEDAPYIDLLTRLLMPHTANVAKGSKPGAEYKKIKRWIENVTGKKVGMP